MKESAQCGYIRCSDWGKQWNPKNSWRSNKTREGTLQIELSIVTPKLIGAVDYVSLVQEASTPPPRDNHNVRTYYFYSKTN